MITHNSLAANVRFAQNNMPLKPGDPLVSFLPLAHTYGCAFEFLFPFTIGCHITILSKTPSPQIIIQAFKEIKAKTYPLGPSCDRENFQKTVASGHKQATYEDFACHTRSKYNSA